MSDEQQGEAELDEYGHHVVDGVSVSGPASPGYHDPDSARLQGEEFSAEPAHITPGALAGDPDLDREQEEFPISDAGPSGERA